jgi:hypothetical protein
MTENIIRFGQNTHVYINEKIEDIKGLMRRYQRVNEKISKG